MYFEDHNSSDIKNILDKINELLNRPEVIENHNSR